MKKILFVANVAKEHILKFHVPTIKKFKNEGWKVDVACSGDETIPYCDHQYSMKWKRSPFTFKTLIGIKDLVKIINENNYDIVYCHTPVGGLVARIAAKLSSSKAKVIYFAHGFHFYDGAPFINWLIYYPIEKILAKFTDSIITINKEDYKNANEKLQCKNIYLINGIGIEIDKFANVDKKVILEKYRDNLDIEQDATVLIYLAELIPNKNQKMLLDTLQIVLEKYPNTYLLLAGIDHNNGKDELYAKELKINDNVKFLGWRKDVENLYAASDICVASSIREGFGLNIVEALASGLPVVATKNRGHSTIIDDGINGFLVEINDYQEMAYTVCNLIEKKLKVDINFDEIKKYDEQEIVQHIFNILTK